MVFQYLYCVGLQRSKSKILKWVNKNFWDSVEKHESLYKDVIGIHTMHLLLFENDFGLHHFVLHEKPHTQFLAYQTKIGSSQMHQSQWEYKVWRNKIRWNWCKFKVINHCVNATVFFGNSIVACVFMLFLLSVLNFSECATSLCGERWS